MELNKIGKFILELRTEKGLSQKELAEMIPVTREAVSKWENGKSLPDSSTLLILSKIFNVTIDEILCGQRHVKKDNLKNVTLNLIDECNSKNKKIKTILTITLSLILLLTVTFFGYYFFASYNSIRVYKIEGTGKNFYTNNGILISTKQKSYLRLGRIESHGNRKVEDIKTIELYYLNNKKEKKIIYEDSDADILVTAFYGYDEYYSYYEIDNIEKELYIDLKYNDTQKETIKLNVIKDFSNNLIIYNASTPIGTNKKENNNFTKPEKIEKIISKIKENITPENDTYTITRKMDKEEIMISHFMNEIVLEINNSNNKKIWTYYISKNSNIYYIEEQDNKETTSIIIAEKNIQKASSQEQEIYNAFFENINKYL